ncbi:MAG TPA: flagellar basal body L-ring protein FlgH, partial [Oligoflexia bacterium]|nr:flagellar basal body L-ring protein FlgH [Oligoflexia bacterium]
PRQPNPAVAPGPDRSAAVETAAGPASLNLARGNFTGDPRFLAEGYELKKSVNMPSPQIKSLEGAVPVQTVMLAGQHTSPPPSMLAGPPPGSAAPYLNGQMTANPSLWPDEAQGAYLFSDYRAFQAMDIITIVINEDTKGQKKAETDAESKYSLLAAIENFFGIEQDKWAANNAYLDPSALINAKTNSKFEGDAETKRSGTLKARISAVIMEVFPNGLMRIEGTKIVSLDAEEEIIVISGLVRARDIDSQNVVDSSRIANMRIDFYGQGLLAENTKPGWGVRVFQTIWPF